MFGGKKNQLDCKQEITDEARSGHEGYRLRERKEVNYKEMGCDEFILPSDEDEEDVGNEDVECLSREANKKEELRACKFEALRQQASIRSSPHEAISSMDDVKTNGNQNPAKDSRFDGASHSFSTSSDFTAENFAKKSREVFDEADEDEEEKSNDNDDSLSSISTIINNGNNSKEGKVAETSYDSIKFDDDLPNDLLPTTATSSTASEEQEALRNDDRARVPGNEKNKRERDTDYSDETNLPQPKRNSSTFETDMFSIFEMAPALVHKASDPAKALEQFTTGCRILLEEYLKQQSQVNRFCPQPTQLV